jgi:hypothetical protein
LREPILIRRPVADEAPAAFGGEVRDTATAD